MKMTICRRFTFEAAHYLPNVPAGHKCGRMHGHSYTLEIEIRGFADEHEVGETGWLVDFGELDAACAPLIAMLDHRTLNELVPNPTSERLCLFVWRWFLGNVTLPFGCELERVRVAETSRSHAELRR